MTTPKPPNLMSVAEMIDTAFGDPDVNVVNHKLIQTVLFILGRQLRILERRVDVEIGPGIRPSSSSLSVTEIKLHAMQKKKKKSVDSTSTGGGVGGEVKKGVRSSPHGARTGTISPGHPAKPGSSTDDTTTSDRPPSQRKTAFKESSDKTSSDVTSSSKTAGDKTSSDKTSSGKTSSDKTSSDKSSSNKASSGKSASDRTASEKEQSDKTSSGKSSSDKTSSAKTSSDKTSSDKTTSDKILPGKASKYSTSEPMSSDKTSSKDKSSSDKRSTDKSTRRDPGYLAGLLETVELQREEELRVIRQRTDSHEESNKTPSPMASMDSMEATYEKLLVVERIPSDKAKTLAAKGRSGAQEKAPRLSVVTQDQFEELAKVVRQLQQKFGPVGSASFPENVQLMKDLRKGASLTDAMAALQLSARLEASEKAMEQMMSLVTDLAKKTPGINLNASDEEDMQVLFGAGVKDTDTASTRKSTLQKSALKTKKEASPPESSSEGSLVIPLPESATPLEAGTERDGISGAGGLGGRSVTGGTGGADDQKEPPDRITYDELDNALQELYDEMIKTVNDLTKKTATNADNALKMALKLEGKLDASLNLGTRMQDLEALVLDYSEKINIMDTTLSSQMTNYQEELTQMQHELETALDTMAEVLANAGGDTTAVAELNSNFSNLQLDIEDTMMRQKELRNTQNALAFDLDSLRKQIEILRDTKADREEVADALRDKVGLGALNGLVTYQQFDVIRGDIEKRIGAAYDKFNSQESIWQKVIDDLIRELNEKADWIQVVSLKEEINKYIEMLRSRLNAIVEIVGEPKAAAVMKRLHRNANCLSCATPADMELTEHGKVPALPALRPPTIGAEAAKPNEQGDNKPCLPGYPVPHHRDSRAEVCQRWCGGAHTLTNNNALNRAPPGMVITTVDRQVATALGTDGKLYKIDEMEPCRQCIRKSCPQPSIQMVEQTQEMVDIVSSMTPPDFQTGLASTQMLGNETPPPPQDEN